MFEVFFSHEAEKRFHRLDRPTRGRITAVVEILKQTPLHHPHIKRLSGELTGKHRYQLGGIRIVYEVNLTHRRVTVITIGFRGDIYK